jgi:hypothetical protein
VHAPFSHAVSFLCSTRLHLYQRLVEARESAHLLTVFRGTGAAAVGNSDVKHTLALWRDRLPSNGHTAEVWDAILSWRTVVFNVLSDIATVGAGWIAA